MTSTNTPTTVWTVTVVADTQDATFTTVMPTREAAVGYLRDLFDLPADLDDASVPDALNLDPTLTDDGVRFVMIEDHTL